MIKTVMLVVPTLFRTKDRKKLAMDPWEQKEKLDYALHHEHYHVKLLIAYEYRKVLYTQYILEKEEIDGDEN